MPEPRRPDRRVIGFALLASAAALLLAGFLIASGTFDLPERTRWLATIALCGTAAVDALLSLRFLLGEANRHRQGYGGQEGPPSTAQGSRR